jgi:hypothetical protein
MADAISRDAAYLDSVGESSGRENRVMEYHRLRLAREEADIPLVPSPSKSPTRHPRPSPWGRPGPCWRSIGGGAPSRGGSIGSAGSSGRTGGRRVGGADRAAVDGVSVSPRPPGTAAARAALLSRPRSTLQGISAKPCWPGPAGFETRRLHHGRHPDPGGAAERPAPESMASETTRRRVKPTGRAASKRAWLPGASPSHPATANLGRGLRRCHWLGLLPV